VIPARLATTLPVGATICGCHSTQHQAFPATSTSTAAPTTTRPAAPATCPAVNANAPIAPTNVLVTCDLGRATLCTLAPETMQLVLTRVEPPKARTSDFYEVTLTMDPASATAWASYKAAHLRDHVAFIRDDLVLEAPIIEEPVTSGRIALTTQTPQAADQLAQLAGRPA
jgi:preprotein translocase subunit SecD